MSSSAIHQRVAGVIDELFGVPPAALHKDVELAAGLQLDSLSVVELIVALEDAFGVRFDDTAPGEVTTMGDLVAAVQQATGAIAALDGHRRSPDAAAMQVEGAGAGDARDEEARSA